jgi:hypothetical protein
MMRPEMFGLGAGAWLAIGVTLLTVPIWLAELRLLAATLRRGR